VPASDVARLLLGIERALARAAGHVTGRTVKPTGRWELVVQEAVRLRLVGLRRGSVVAVLDVPTSPVVSDGLLELKDIANLGEYALDRALKTANATSSGDRDVAAAFAEWASEMGVGTRYEAIEIRRRQGPKWQVVRIDEKRRERLAAISGGRSQRSDRVVGRLVEADFENSTARLRVPSGRIVVQFQPEHADTIQRALRHQASVVGTAVVDPSTNTVASIKVQEIEAGEQLETGLAPGSFWDNEDIDARALAQGIKGPQRLEDLVDTAASKEEIEAVMAAEDE